ncbi:hypothetical protein BAE44_0006604, partial [Dichanthelium oligosanthes]
LKKMTPIQLLEGLLHNDLVEKDIAMSMGQDFNHGITLNASTMHEAESSKHVTKKKKNKNSIDEGSTDKEATLVIKNLKRFFKKKGFKKGYGDKDKKKKRKFFECHEEGHFIMDCPYKKSKDRDKSNNEEKRKNHKEKYQGQAHIGQEWDSDDEASNSDGGGAVTIAIQKTSPSQTLFTNLSDDEDVHFPMCSMAKGTKVVWNFDTLSSLPNNIENNF